MKKEIELIGCPWCGKCPKISSSQSRTLWFVECDDIFCRIKPSTVGENLYFSIKSWNNRVNPKDELKYVLDIDLSSKKGS